MPRADLGIILAAPKGPRPTLRNRCQRPRYSRLVGVHQTGDADAELHSPLGNRDRLHTGSDPFLVCEECETDLFGEQVIRVVESCR